MSLIYEERLTDSPYLESVTHGHTLSAGSTIRPAESSWHMVFVREQGSLHPLIVGPWTSAGVASWGEGGEILWLRFKVGTYIPHLPTRTLLNRETALPSAASRSFWLKGSAWQPPSYENAETFVDRLVREEILAHDPVIDAVLHEQPPQMPLRTLRHRFRRIIGLTQSHIRQVERAKHAARLLENGVSILDVVHEAGYFDQPHLTRSLRQFTGYTPAQIVRMRQPR